MRFKVVMYIRVTEEDPDMYGNLLAAAKAKNELEYEYLSGTDDKEVSKIFKIEEVGDE